ncbi:hypothetical protein MPER_08046, partial [Moniliophthora perniciosa FA553]
MLMQFQAATLRIVGVKHLFVVPRIRTSSYLDMLASKFPDLKHSAPGEIQEEALPELRNLIVVDNKGLHKDELRKLDIRSVIDWRDILMWKEGTQKRRVEEISRTIHKDDIVNMQFTSGTTGLPKAVASLFFASLRLVLGNLAAWVYGAAIAYPSEVFDPPSIIDAIIEEKCTALHGVPTHFLGVLTEVERRKKEGDRLDMSSLRTGIAAGSVQPHVKAQLIDPDGNVVPIGKPGELCVAGYLLQKGYSDGHPFAGWGRELMNDQRYWGGEEQTRKVMRKDEEDTLWMHTGDEGVMDHDGYLKTEGSTGFAHHRCTVVGRIKIEDVLLKNHDIHEAAAIAVPDSKYGEVVGVWVVRTPGTNASRAEVKKTVFENMNPTKTGIHASCPKLRL